MSIYRLPFPKNFLLSWSGISLPMRDPIVEQPSSSPAPGRRSFLKQSLAALLGATAGLVPVVASLTVFLDPLRRRSGSSDFLRITSLEALPPDGQPRKFAVVADRLDGWNKFPNVPIGAVYLRRLPDNKVEASQRHLPARGLPGGVPAFDQSVSLPVPRQQLRPGRCHREFGQPQSARPGHAGG